LSLNTLHPADPPRRPTPEKIWDLFIDELARRGQAGSAADVVIPPMDLDVPSGKRFGELSRVDVQNLSRIAESLGRRGDTIKGIWERTQQGMRPKKVKPPKAARKPPR
jgi:hypothetical protein